MHIGDLRLGIHDLQVAFKAGNAFGITLNDRVDLLDRTEEDVGEQQECHEFAHLDLALDEEPCAADHHEYRDQTHQHIADGRAFCHRFISQQLGGAELLVLFLKQLILMLFVRKRLNHADAADIVFDAGIEIAHVSEQLTISRGHSAAELNDQPCHQRHNDKGQQRKLQVDVGHQGEGT